MLQILSLYFLCTTDSLLNTVLVEWNEVVKIAIAHFKFSIAVLSMHFLLQLSRDEYCIHMVNYTVVLVDSVLGEIVKQVEVGSDSCEDDVCSTLLFLSPSNQTYAIIVIAINIIGLSSPAT